MCKVSVLMSVYYEKEEYLRSAIESILGQTFSDFEFLVYDDGTSAENKIVLAEYAQKDSRIKIIENQENQGLTYNLICGLKVAKGVYVARMDSDDISEASRLAKQVDYMDRHLDVCLLTTKVNKMGGKKQLFLRWITPNDYLKAALLFNNSMPHPTAMMRKSFLEEHNLNYDIKVKKAQDYDLWVRIARIGKIAFLKTPLVRYRIHGGQISSKSAGEQKYFVDLIRLQQLHDMGIDLSVDEEQIYLSFCDGKLGMKVWKCRRTIKRIRKEIMRTGSYNNFWIRYIFQIRFIRNCIC